jgi:hypothetical protein
LALRTMPTSVLAALTHAMGRLNVLSLIIYSAQYYFAV